VFKKKIINTIDYEENQNFYSITQKQYYYYPDLNCQENPNYYEQNKILFYLNVVRFQRRQEKERNDLFTM